VGHNARVIGRWFDDEGEATGLPAMLVSDRGAYLSHIVLSDDGAAKRQMLAAVLGHLEPTLWQPMVEAEYERLGVVGHFHSQEEILATLGESTDADVRSHFADAVESKRQAHAARQAGRFAACIEHLRVAHGHLVKAYLLSQPSREVEGRAWWNHSGTGPYPGDWERAAEELAAAGVRGLLNLASAHLHVPDHVAVLDARMLESLQELSHIVHVSRKKNGEAKKRI